jgi:hypothetical protein
LEGSSLLLLLLRGVFSFRRKSAAAGVRNLMSVPRHSFAAKASEHGLCACVNFLLMFICCVAASKEELQFAKLKSDYQKLCLSDDEPDSMCPKILLFLKDFDHKVHKVTRKNLWSLWCNFVFAGGAPRIGRRFIERCLAGRTGCNHF